MLDIGTGQDVIWARESVQAGAQQVLAVEAIEDSFHRAAANLRLFGLQDKVTLLRGESTSVEFAPKADVCVAEVIGSFAGAEGAAVVVADAKRRLLTPDGVIVPQRAVTRAAAVRLSDLFAGRPVAFSTESVKYLRAIFDWNGASFDVRLRMKNPPREALLSTDKPIEDLDFNGDLRPRQQTTVRLTVHRPGAVDGVLTWLELWCLPDEEPLDALRTRCSWASIYFPLFRTPVPVNRGDTLDLSFAADIGDDGVHPDYRLAATVRTAAGEQSATFDSPHHGGAFRTHPVYRVLFPGKSGSSKFRTTMQER